MNEYRVEQKVLRVVGDIIFGTEPLDHETFTAPTGGKMGNHVTRKNDDGLARLRLDYEYEGNPEDLDVRRVEAEMFYHIVRDLTDLFWNGDTMSDDPLLKQINGFKKNPDRADPVITNLTLFREWAPKKNTIEYTLYFLVNK